MTNVLDSLPIPTLGAAGLLALAVWLILTGRIVPRRHYEDIEADRDRWRTAAEQWQTAHAEQAKPVAELIEIGRTTERLLQAMVDERDRRTSP